MSKTPPNDDSFHAILAALNAGREGAYESLLPLLYEELRTLARSHLERERPGHTLQPTALVNEAWIRLAGSPPGPLESRAHFFGVAAEAMRRILVDHARKHLAAKRGARAQRVTLADLSIESEGSSLDLLDLDAALEDLRAVDERAARVVELRYFVGLSVEESAASLGVSEPTIKRDFAYARAWLTDRLRDE